MPGVVGHNKRQHSRTCRFCGEEFQAKHPRAQVCPEEQCQRAYKVERDRRSYERKKAEGQ